MDTFTPFQKVLVRNYDTEPWDIDLFIRYEKEWKNNNYVCFRSSYNMCIPYEGNESLFNKVEDKDKEFKFGDKVLCLLDSYTMDCKEAIFVSRKSPDSGYFKVIFEDDSKVTILPSSRVSKLKTENME